MRLARVLGAIGRTCITAGVLILLFVAYQLWGTGLAEARSQNKLEDQFADLLETVTPVTEAPTPTTVEDSGPTTTTSSTLPPAPPAPDGGQPVARIVIPEIGVDKIVVEGVSVADLKRAPGHYPGTSLPGLPGNAAIAGHRTTWGAPFHNIDKMQPGDVIDIETQQGSFRYEMTEQLIVSPTDTYVLDDVGDNRLTLTACHPKLSSKQRIVIHAVLVGAPVEELPGQEESPSPSDREPVQRAAIDEFESEPIARFPGAWWGLVCIAAWAATRLAAWSLRRSSLLVRAVPYVIGTPVCLFLLYLFFESVSYEALSRALHL